MKFKKIRIAICLFAGFLLVFLLSFGVQVSSYQKYACRLTRNIQKLNSSLKILGWTQADLDLVKQQSNPGVYLIDLISETGEVFRPTAQSSNLSSGQIVLFSTWDTIFTELIPRYDDNAKEVSVILHRGTLGNREFKFWIPQSLNETNVDIVGKYTAVLLANGLTSLGAESVTISDERVAEEVKKLYDPYYAGNGEYKDKIDVEITLKDGSAPFTVEVDVPSTIKRFNSSDNQAENLNGQIKDFALDISESVKNAMQAQDISIDEISNILVPCDRHTFVKLALIEKLFAGTFGIEDLKSDKAKKYLNKLERFPYFDNQAGTMQDVNAWGEGTKFEISNISPVENIGITTQQSRAPPVFNPNDGKIIGIDLGSTGVKISVIKDGVPVREERYESIYGKTVGETEKVLIDKIKGLLQKSDIGFGDIDAVGISWAGPVNENKVVGASKIRFDMIGSPLGEIKNFPDSLRNNFLNEGLRESIPVVMVNDGDAGGFNVYLKEGRPSKVAFLGLGGGLAFTKLTNGSFVQGFNEWGRSELDMANNNIQAFTTHALTTGYLSGTGIANIARSLGMNVTDAKDVSDLFEQNDEDALKVVDIVAENLAESVYWLQKTYGDLDSVLLGGGAMQGQFGQTIKDKAQLLLKNKYQIGIQLKCCDNPEYAVAYGAAQYANQVRQQQLQQQIIDYVQGKEIFELDDLVKETRIDSKDKLRSILHDFIEKGIVQEYMETIKVGDDGLPELGQNNRPQLSGTLMTKNAMHGEGETTQGQGSWHVCVHVMIKDKNGNVLIQKVNKKGNPFDIAGSGHWRVGETLEEGAIRELTEEIKGFPEVLDVGDVQLVSRKIGRPDIAKDSFDENGVLYGKSSKTDNKEVNYLYVVAVEELLERDGNIYAKINGKEYELAPDKKESEAIFVKPRAVWVDEFNTAKNQNADYENVYRSTFRQYFDSDLFGDEW